MSGATITFDLDVAGLRPLVSALDDQALGDIMYGVGQLVENQTKERIATEKRAPGGEPWAPWSADYAATRRGAQSLLVSDNNLLTSIQNYTRGLTAEVGSNLVYAAIHQFGGAGAGKPGLPARPYLGLSSGNEDEIRDLVIDVIREAILQ